MNLDLSEEQQLLQETFAQLFAALSSPECVRAAEPSGFDPALWKQLAETGALGVRVPEAAGGSDGSLLDAAVIAAQAGRRLASVPLLEGILAGRLLAASPGPEAASWLARLLDGDAVVSLALHPLGEAPKQWVAAAGVADALIALDADQLVLLPRAGKPPVAPPGAPGAAPLGCFQPRPPVPLGAGAVAREAFGAAVEEWKLLMAAALAGLAREALEMAGRYASERVQFDRPIGSFQGLAHPLAESAADVEGARLLVWRAIWAIAAGRGDAAALISMAFAWSSLVATTAVARALHVHGGYGLSLEYDIQLYHRRAKAWPLVYGDPQQELLCVAARSFDTPPPRPALPDAGALGLSFELGPEAQAFARTARRFFAENLDEELRRHAHFAWEGHHPGFQRKLAQAGLLFPSWPKAYGGQERSAYEMAALSEVFHEHGWTRHAIATTGMIGQTLMRFGSEPLKQEVLPRFARGEAICSMGFTEPAAGSDVAAAQTRAVRDGDSWVIDGQKMFTSGANLAQYVFLLTRTNPEARKHKGLTMFLLPLDTPGIEIQPVETLSDERTNITYYSGVRVPDRYRVGPVDGGWEVITCALDLEHGGGFAHMQRSMLEGALAWARSTRRGSGFAIDEPSVRERLARAAIHTTAADSIGCQAIFARASGKATPAIGPMAKFFSTDRFIEDAADLMDLCAPDSLLRGREGGGAEGASAVEFAYRLSTAMSIYGGTSEIMKSLVAQASLGLPRSRS